MPTYDTRCTRCAFEDEINKPIHAVLPRCPQCDGELKQVYHAPAVLYASGGFSATDGRLEKMVGHERYAKFKAHKNDAETRAKYGQLTGYEQALEATG